MASTGSLGEPSSQSEPPLKELIDEVDLRHPDADVFICNITHAYSDEVGGVKTTTYTQDQITDLHEGVDDINADMSTQLASKVDGIIDIDSVLNPATETMANDGLHPNPDGLGRHLPTKYGAN